MAVGYIHFIQILSAILLHRQTVPFVVSWGTLLIFGLIDDDIHQIKYIKKFRTYNTNNKRERVMGVVSDLELTFVLH